MVRKEKAVRRLVGVAKALAKVVTATTKPSEQPVDSGDSDPRRKDSTRSVGSTGIGGIGAIGGIEGLGVDGECSESDEGENIPNIRLSSDASSADYEHEARRPSEPSAPQTDAESDADGKDSPNWEEDFIDEARLWLSESRFFKYYLFSSFALTLIEAVFIGYPLTKANLITQQVILALSTALFFAYILATYTFIPHHSNLTQFKKIKKTMTLEIVFELCTLILGWVLLHVYPGLAALRCLRLFRFCWFFEFVYAHRRDTFLVWLLRNAQVSVDYLERNYEYFCSRRTPGAAVVLLMLFFLCYVFAAALYGYTQGDKTTNCDSLLSCYLFMFRLALLDATGWSFVDELYLQPNLSALNVLVLIFIILSTIILTNGLKGILGFLLFDTDDEIIQVETILLDTTIRRSRIQKLLKTFDTDLCTAISIRKQLHADIRKTLIQVKFEYAAYALGSTHSIADIEVAIESGVALNEQQIQVLNQIVSTCSICDQHPSTRRGSLQENFQYSVAV